MFSAAGVAEVLHHGVIDSIGSSLGYVALALVCQRRSSFLLSGLGWGCGRSGVLEFAS